MRLRKRSRLAALVAVAVGLVVPSTASAGQQVYGFQSNLGRVCTVRPDLEKQTTAVVFDQMTWSVYASCGVITDMYGNTDYMFDMRGSSLDLFNVSTGQEVSGSSISWECGYPCQTASAAAQTNVLKNSQTYVARTDAYLDLGVVPYCAQWATDSKGHQYCADPEYEHWTSVPSGCTIIDGSVPGEAVSCSSPPLTSTTEPAS